MTSCIVNVTTEIHYCPAVSRNYDGKTREIIINIHHAFFFSDHADSSVIEDYCGIEPIRHPEELIEKRADPEVDQKILANLYKNTSTVLAGKS